MPEKIVCEGTTQAGKPCNTREVPGLGYCLRHLPDESLDAAERMGYCRCKALVNSKISSRYGERCANIAVNDTGKCEFHQPRDSWLVPTYRDGRRTIARIHKISREAGIDTTKVANPLQALLELAAEAMNFKDELGRRVVALDETEWTYEHVAGEQIKGDLLLYERALERVSRMLSMITRLGVEERLARVSERQAHLVEQALSLTLEELGLDLGTQDRARDLVAKRLRAVE